MLTKREVAMNPFSASIFYVDNAHVSLVYFGYMANGINRTYQLKIFLNPL